MQKEQPYRCLSLLTSCHCCSFSSHINRLLYITCSRARQLAILLGPQVEGGGAGRIARMPWWDGKPYRSSQHPQSSRTHCTIDTLHPPPSYRHRTLLVDELKKTYVAISRRPRPDGDIRSILGRAQHFVCHIHGRSQRGSLTN